tara:strand:+ start:1781 stop:2212 length:432 start_codon:yes stop_codon:yes gene_type:complete
LLKGGGPEVTSPPSRIFPIISLVAIAIPMLSTVNLIPLGLIAKAPFFRHCSASGMSFVTQMSVFLDITYNPIVCRIGFLINNDEVYKWIAGRTDSSITHHISYQIMACRDSFYFVFNWTSVGIYINFDHFKNTSWGLRFILHF